MRRVSPEIRANARALRKSMTDAEQQLWSRIRGRQLLGFRFRRQHPVGPYIVDFVCLEPKLVVELDGSQHMEQGEDDQAREWWLQEKGFSVLRFWNNEIFDDLDGVLEAICLRLPPSQPSP